MSDASNNLASNPAFAHVSINIHGLSLNFQVADRAALSSFFNDHSALADIRAGLYILEGKAHPLSLIERKALDHALTTGADAAAVTVDNAKAEGSDADYSAKETVLTAVQVDPTAAVTTGQSISTGEERTEGETTAPAKRTRRTKAEMEAARLAEAAAKADAGAVPALPATPAPVVPVAPAPAAAAPAVASLPTLPPAPAAPALPAPPAAIEKPPAMLAGQVIDAIHALVDEGRDPAKMVEWLFAYGIVNAKDVGYETAQATIRLMNDEQLQKVAEALGLLDD